MNKPFEKNKPRLYDLKYLPSKYKYVAIHYDKRTGLKLFALTVPNASTKCYTVEREAALPVDKILISRGKNPVNILVKKVSPHGGQTTL